MTFVDNRGGLLGWGGIQKIITIKITVDFGFCTDNMLLLTMVPEDGTMGLMMDFLYFFSFSTSLNCGCKYNLCRQLGLVGGGLQGWGGA